MARILIVDDEHDVVELVGYLLTREGHEILRAFDGKEGLESALAHRPDLIVLDIMMPQMDGYSMNNQLLEHATARQIPVIVLTAKGGIKETSDMAPNVRFHMEKPFDPRDLRARVSEVLANPGRS